MSDLYCHICGSMLNGLIYEIGVDLYVGYSCCVQLKRYNYECLGRPRRVDRFKKTDVLISGLEELSSIQSSAAVLPCHQNTPAHDRSSWYLLCRNNFTENMFNRYKYKLL